MKQAVNILLLMLILTYMNVPSKLDSLRNVFVNAVDGNGIPQKVVEKIFQPFFTTKPSGQGTDLALSLSYDIIKTHGGELKVETKEGKESEFIIHFRHK